MIYVIDTDSLITLNRLYTPEFFSDLWDQLDKAIETSPEWRKDLPG